MKNKINILLACLIIGGMVACDTAGGIDADIFQPGDAAALAVWVDSPSGNLILSDPSSSVSFEVEFIDETDGSSVESFAMLVETRGKDADGDEIVLESGTLLSSSSFSASANGNQGYSGSFDLTDVASALNVTVASLSEGDEFFFTTTITRGGVVYPTGNANQFLESVRDFSREIAVETTSIQSVTIKTANVGIGLTSTVVMAFANDFTDSLAVMPTLEILSGGGDFGAVTAIAYMDEDDEDNFGKDSVYQAVYDPTLGTPAVDGAKVTFRILNASSTTAAGFGSVADTTKSKIAVDLTVPTIVGNNGSGPVSSGALYNLFLSEPIGSVTLTEDFTGIDDDEDELIDGLDTDGDAVKVDVEFTDNVLDFTYEWEDDDGEVTLTLVIKDTAGNPLDLSGLGLDSITLTPVP